MIESLLERIRSGDDTAFGALFGMLYRELHASAAKKHARLPQSVQATDLLHMVFVRMRKASWNDKRHFFRHAAVTMRSVLADFRRGKLARKRLPPGERLDLDLIASDFDRRSRDVAELHDALNQLHDEDPDLAEIVDLRFFANRTEEECAQLLEVGSRTIRRRWKAARERLHALLGPDTNSGEAPDPDGLDSDGSTA